MRLLVNANPPTVIKKVGADAYRQWFGMLIAPRDGGREVSADTPWALDNDAYSGFSETRYRALLDRYEGKTGCLFATAPDVVGNALSTLVLFSEWQPIIKTKGYPVALVAQDGLQHLIIPWDDLDALFIGGTTAFKLSADAIQIAHEAKQRGKWVHMGRVNGNRRLRLARYWNCDSVDGSSYIAILHKCQDAKTVLMSPWLPVEKPFIQPELEGVFA